MAAVGREPAMNTLLANDGTAIMLTPAHQALLADPETPMLVVIHLRLRHLGQHATPRQKKAALTPEQLAWCAECDIQPWTKRR